ncbi:hypothetical protein [Streptomyces sp. NPDC002324]
MSSRGPVNKPVSPGAASADSTLVRIVAAATLYILYIFYVMEEVSTRLGWRGRPVW